MLSRPDCVPASPVRFVEPASLTGSVDADEELAARSEQAEELFENVDVSRG
jgi:hypothetical protein